MKANNIYSVRHGTARKKHLPLPALLLGTAVMVMALWFIGRNMIGSHPRGSATDMPAKPQKVWQRKTGGGTITSGGSSSFLLVEAGESASKVYILGADGATISSTEVSLGGATKQSGPGALIINKATGRIAAISEAGKATLLDGLPGVIDAHWLGSEGFVAIMDNSNPQSVKQPFLCSIAGFDQKRNRKWTKTLEGVAPLSSAASPVGSLIAVCGIGIIDGTSAHVTICQAQSGELLHINAGQKIVYRATILSDGKIVLNQGETVTCYDASGTMLWSYESPFTRDIMNISTKEQQSRIILVGSGYSSQAISRIFSADRVTVVNDKGERLWSRSFSSHVNDVAGGPEDSILVCTDKGVTALDREGKTLWEIGINSGVKTAYYHEMANLVALVSGEAQIEVYRVGK